jgi:Aspartate oxidase
MLYDVIVVGSGIAGLMSALHAKRAGLSVAVLTKTTPFRSSSAVASGGINAVFGADDSIQSHMDDTIAGGDGLAHRVSVSQMCSEAPSIIEELLEIGVEFAANEEGTPKQRPFGGASKVRTCYSADKTGAAITQKLFGTCREAGVEIFANHMLLSIAKYKEQLSGVVVLKRSNSHVIAMACKSLILAGGGYAGIYRGHTTNAPESSGDMLAIAHRAGLVLSNLEFMQFHPTTLSHGGTLISEAARGEGGYIVDESGERFVDELQTRDKLSRAILLHMKAGHKVYLDLRHLGSETIDEQLPSTKKRH